MASRRLRATGLCSERASPKRSTRSAASRAAITSDWGFSPREVTVPVRSWHGGSDMLVPVPHAEHLVDLLPDATIEVFEGDGHFAGYSRAPTVLDWLLEQAEVKVS